MYYPQGDREPNGCIETLVISRIVFGMLLVPLLMVFGAIFAIVLTLVALSIHPLLALLCLVICVTLIIAMTKWESDRVKRQMPNDRE